MSEVITLTTGESETMHGTFAAGTQYLNMMLGDQYAAFQALTTDDARKKCFATAVRYLNRFSWNPATAGTFAARDAITDVEGKSPFAMTNYELAAIAASDPSVLATTETGNNVKAAGAGSARVEFFARTSVAAGTSAPLPDVAMQLVGSYLGGATGVDLTYGQSGNCESAFEDSREFELVWPK